MKQDSIQAAEIHYRSGNYVAAASLLRTLSPSADSVRLLGLCRLRQGFGPASLYLLKQAQAMDPLNGWGQMHLALALQQAGRHAEAVPLLRASTQALPDEPAPLLNLSSSLLALADTQGAVQAASEACHLAPGCAEAHYTYGLALLAAGSVAHAAQAFGASVQLAPSLVEGWLNLGVCLYRQADMPGAIAAMRHVLTLAPFHRAATANLGAFLRLTGQADAAEQLLRDLLARDPQATAARLNLAADLLNEERPGEALSLLESVQPPLPGQRIPWELQQSLALLQLGRTTEARALLVGMQNTVGVLRPQFLFRQMLLAVAENRCADAEALATEMEVALAEIGAAALPEHRIMAHFDLAKFWSTHAAHDRAFSHWVSGHKLLSAFQPFSRTTHRAAVDATMEAFGKLRLTHGHRATNADPAPVFIVGMPRSGTTLAERILAAHAQTHGAGERGALQESYERLGGRGFSQSAARKISGLDTESLDTEAASYLAALHGLAPEADRIIDKMPGNFIHLGLIGLMLPGARIIHCRRDSRDIGLSIFTYRFHGHHPYAHDLADLGWYIAEHDRLCAFWREVLPNPILDLHLHEWVDDFDATLARVLRFLDLPFDPACARFHESETRVRTVSRSQVKQRINASGLGRWRPYAQHLSPLFQELGLKT